MKFKDYYQTLNVSRDVTQDQLKQSYRRLARRYHPDVSKETNAEQRFKELGEAYEVLKDPEKRAAYDRFGSDWKQGQEFRPPPDWDAGFEFSGGGFTGTEGFSDFFESLFGQRTGHGRAGGGFQAQGQDHHAKILVTLEDAYHGATRTISLQTPGMDASGHVRAGTRSLNVRIPRGVTEGQRIRLAGQGSPGIGGGPRGDLYLEIAYEPHRLFRPDGRDLYLDLPVTPWEAGLGATVTVPTPGGRVDLKLPPGSQSGQKLRLKGKGMSGRDPGDLFAVLKIMTPKPTSDADREIYEKMANQMAFDPRASM
ncbi:MAG: DnaJ C-terminal domain-containing protein [Pseudomonadota bacterium]|nr:DnaJ C-terminal domain-containing protein [Pseudomonadota bacterium]